MGSRLVATAVRGKSSRTWSRKVAAASEAGFCVDASVLPRLPVDLVPDHPILVRDFIHRALYHPQHGYFSTKPQVVGILSEPLDFNLMKGRREYTEHLSALYKQNDASWFTPVELFKPWYGYGLASFILRNHNPAFPLQIYEIGGGTGTCARSILDYIKLKAPAVYQSMGYVSIEISDALAKVQLECVHTVNSHKSRYCVECRDACNKYGWGEVDERPCFFIMLEVLDNQPHDLVCKKSVRDPWLETYITKEDKRSESPALTEMHRPLQDASIKRCIEIMESASTPTFSWMSAIRHFVSIVFSGSKKAWIPTGSLQLLEALYAVRPNAAIIASDFSVLPDVKVEGDRAPLVARKKDGVTMDLSSYLDVQGDADIFFPTDFWFLRDLDQHCYRAAAAASVKCSREPIRKRVSRVVPSSEFMRQFVDISETRTKDGFNPLLDDYSNVKFYWSVPAA